MGREIDDSVKQKLLNSLSKEPTMVISTAYAYAKNYVEYGEDITKAWTTAVQQASILEQIKIKAKAEAYDSFKKEYEARLKADMAAMLEELDLTIDEISIVTRHGVTGTVMTAQGMRKKIKENIQHKINALKENSHDD